MRGSGKVQNRAAVKGVDEGWGMAVGIRVDKQGLKREKSARLNRGRALRGGTLGVDEREHLLGDVELLDLLPRVGVVAEVAAVEGEMGEVSEPFNGVLQPLGASKSHSLARSLGVDGPLETELLHNHSGACRKGMQRQCGKTELEERRGRTEVEVLEDNLGDVLIRVALLVGAVRVDEDGEGLSDTNGVRELNKDALGEASSDEGLGDPATGVGSRTVDLGPVLSGEGSSTVGSPSSVGVDLLGENVSER